MTKDIDISHLKEWIGKSETVSDYLTNSLIDRFCATLDPFLWSEHNAAPLGIQWCTTLPATQTSDLSEDGHAKKGGFLPPVPLPARMWAGGEITHHHNLEPDAPVTRVSRVSDVVAKTGKSGSLIFVTVEQELSSRDRLCITERQDFVFKDFPKADSPKPTAQVYTDTGTQMAEVSPNPVLLFRYSALTFNAHRIHYDQDYARNTEGYPDLVVHGPLQATLLLNLAAKILGKPPRRFSYRGLAPVTLDRSFSLFHAEGKNGGKVWCETDNGVRSFVAHYSDD
ncbi:MAG: MaoC family dehydratase N-terminal domain-containing protein [Roseovarius sp.]|nr:MaoC family dehydratase N-terminal domain-containing protein [Roseovarius sp.]